MSDKNIGGGNAVREMQRTNGRGGSSRIKPRLKRVDGSVATKSPLIRRKKLSRRRARIAKVSRKAHR